MQNLHPTLWRTCKMLAGTTRIRLLRQIYEYPGECVSALGKRVGVGESAASQELRRIQSRGLLQSVRQGTYLIYRMAADPQVATAAPILKAIQQSLRNRAPERDLEMAALAVGLAHERRIRIVQALLHKPQTLSELQLELHIPAHPLHAHLQTLRQSGFMERKEGQLAFTESDHPLAQVLSKLIQQGITR